MEYKDWVLATFPNKEICICIAPRWSGLKSGDLVRVEDMNGLGEVHGCITLRDQDADLIEFISYLWDGTPTKRVIGKYTEVKVP